tara:strand:+ start:620 stop:1030 length:411 start_codon:yes stop_codon:yes gene_type:complete
MIIRILLISFVTTFLSTSENLILAKIGEKEILLEVANTQALRAEGLMGVKALEYNQGMIFIWPNASRKCMWMKNTLIDLSVAFIDRDRKISEIKELQSKSLESICSSEGNVIAAVEMNRGWFKENNIKLGAKVLLP